MKAIVDLAEPRGQPGACERLRAAQRLRRRANFAEHPLMGEQPAHVVDQRQAFRGTQIGLRLENHRERSQHSRVELRRNQSEITSGGRRFGELAQEILDEMRSQPQNRKRHHCQHRERPASQRACHRRAPELVPELARCAGQTVEGTRSDSRQHHQERRGQRQGREPAQSPG